MVLKKRNNRQGVLPLVYDIEPSSKTRDGLKSPDSFQLLDDAHGKITHVFMQYTSPRELGYISSLVNVMDDDVEFTILRKTGSKRSESDNKKLDSILSESKKKISFVETDKDFTPWAQDRTHVVQSPYGVALLPGVDGEDGFFSERKISLGRRSEQSSYKLLSESFPGYFVEIRKKQKNLRLGYFQGGDVETDEDTVFVGADTLNENLEKRKRRYQRIRDNLFYRNFDGFEDLPKKMFFENEDKTLNAASEQFNREKADFKILDEEGARTLIELDGNVIAEEEYTGHFKALWVKQPNPHQIQEHWEYLEGSKSWGDTTHDEIRAYDEKISEIDTYKKIGYETETVRKIRGEILDKIGKISGNKNVEFVGLPNPPFFHLDLFFKTVGDKTVVVGDLDKGRELIEKEGLDKRDFQDVENNIRDGEDDYGLNYTSGEVLDAIAKSFEKKGYKVARAPIFAPTKLDNLSHITYCNVEVENFKEDGEDKKRVYMPTYGLKEMDAEAERVWKNLGFEVRRVDGVDNICKFHGSLRCALKVLSRDYEDNKSG